MPAYGFLALALTLNALANVLIKYSMTRPVRPLLPVDGPVASFLSWPYLLGILCFAANLACYSMALSAQLSRAEFPPKRIHTTAQVFLEKVNEGFKITKIVLDVEAEVPGIDAALFMEKAEIAKKTCPVSVALGAIDEIVLNAKLK